MSIQLDYILTRDDQPALYHTATTESGNAQWMLLLLTKVNIALLITGALLPSINTLYITDSNVKYFINFGGTGFLLLSVILTFALDQQKYERKWYDGRAIAESIKTLTWRYMMNSEPYRSEHNPDERFR